MRKINSGFSLIELLLVLSIVAVMSVASFIVYPRVAQARQQQMAQEGGGSENVDVPVVGLTEEQKRKIIEEDERKRAGQFHSEFENGF